MILLLQIWILLRGLESFPLPHSIYCMTLCIRKITMCLKHTEMSWIRLFQCFSIQTCTEKAYFTRFQYVSEKCTFPDVWKLDKENNPVRTFKLEDNLKAMSKLKTPELPNECKYILRLLSHNSYYLKEAYKFLLCITYNYCWSANNIASFLEAYSYLDIMLIQKLSVNLIWHLSSSQEKESVPLHDTLLYYNWIYIHAKHEKYRVATYINKHRASMFPKLWTDIIDYSDMICISLSLQDENKIYFLNIYNNSNLSVLIYIHNQIKLLLPLHCIARDFNIHDSMWDSQASSNLACADYLMSILQYLSLMLWQDDLQTTTYISFNKKQ